MKPSSSPWSLLVAGLLLGSAAVAGPPGAPSAAPSPSVTAKPKTEFKALVVKDEVQGGLAVGAFSIPKDWYGAGEIRWNGRSANNPARFHARIQAPDGSAWVETFPLEIFTWLTPPDRTLPVGAMTFGMIHAPGIGAVEAMKYFVLRRYRGRAQGVKLVGMRPIGNLAASLHKATVPGDSLAARIQYTVNGHPVEEEFFILLAKDTPVSGEHHRQMAYVHSMGAMDGKLKELHPLLGFIAASYRENPVWVRRRDQVSRIIMQRFNRQMAQNAANRAAIDAQTQQAAQDAKAFLLSVDQKQRDSDAFLRSVDAQQTSSPSGGGASDAFDHYIRDTEVVKDPYWGTSEQPYQQPYHFTDGYGQYQNSSDANFDPNKDSNVQWQQMAPAGE